MRVFISYSRRDTEVANRIAAELTSRGANVFIDYERLQAGENFPERLAFELEKSDAVVFLLSEHSAASKWVRADFQLAFHHDKPIIPVALDNVEMPRAFFFLTVVQRVNLTQRPISKQAEVAIRELVIALGLPNRIEVSSATSRMRDAELLSVLEISRSEGQKLQGMIGPPFDWCSVPRGSVTLEDARSNKGTKGGTYEVPTYAIAKFPIANRQYQVFVYAENGYGNRQWWDYSETAREWRDQKRWQGTETAFLGNDLPRTNVCWYDAVAFCRWLSDRSGLNISLPTEQQWQLAAQGEDYRTFPWGNEYPDKTLCNFGQSVGQPTPVTQYPNSASPYGVMDMSGNVWEWCLTAWGTDSIDLTRENERMVRGGSWANVKVEVLRTANRLGFCPSCRESFNVGFRIAFLV